MLLGERKDCVWVKENMGVLEVLRIVEEAMGKGIRGRRMWYSLKYNRLELLPLGRDGDVKKLMKGNDEYAYLYVAGSEGPGVGRALRNEACEEQWKGVGCTDHRRGEVMVDAACDIARALGGRLEIEHVVSDCYKAGSQNMRYMNNMHSMEEHDSATVDNTTGLGIGGEALDDGYN
ncbi:hypothetical protein Cgig2_002661 [Carnegiea gigantea]|uniref:Uncharacterized protein n=1 Tax=Carnegiea gigantea TaxID=171969 RepID=A0A9Q1QBL7_9CARY|nr:hypothetical protein Cgig2_002661 [Carnegiea gigantea]